MNWDFIIEGKEALTVTTDSRKITEGCVFVALKGEHFNGNLFAIAALESGASYAIVDEDLPQTCSMKKEYGKRIIRVEDSLLALQDLARTWRRALALPIIGITGTNGKTTTKELTAAVLATKYRIHYTQGNLNNAIGVPLTLLQLRRQHELAIVEMGASHPGDINELVNIAEPNYGLITNVGMAHLQGFGSFEGVMRTKRELYEYIIRHKGKLFVNEDNQYLSRMLDEALQATEATPSSARGTDSRTQSGTIEQIKYHSSPMLEGTQLVGAYNSENIQAALCIGRYFGVEEEQAIAAIRAYTPTNNRSQRMQTEHNTLVVDAYNANPTSMQAAINDFKGDAYILGAMRELGEYTHTAHQNIVNMLLEGKAETVLLVGDEYRETTAPYPVFSNVDELLSYLSEHPLKGRTILIKGSRSNQLEKVMGMV